MLPPSTGSKTSTNSPRPDSGRRMARVIVNRLLLTIPLLLLVTMAAFLIGELTPGDRAQVIAGDFATPEAVELVRKELRLEDSRAHALRPLARRRGLGRPRQGDTFQASCRRRGTSAGFR